MPRQAVTLTLPPGDITQIVPTKKEREQINLLQVYRAAREGKTILALPAVFFMADGST